MNEIKKKKRPSTLTESIAEKLLIPSSPSSPMARTEVLSAWFPEWRREGATDIEIVLRLIESEATNIPKRRGEGAWTDVIRSAGEVRRRMAAGDTEGAVLETGQMMTAFYHGIYFGNIARHELSMQGAAKGGQREKRNPEIFAHVRARIRKNPSSTARELWKAIPDDDPEFSYIRIGMKARLYRELGRACVSRKQGKVWVLIADISERAFRDYVAVAKRMTIDR